MKRSVILQTTPSAEVRAVRTGCLLLDDIQIYAGPVESLPQHRNALASGDMLPVGTVEFVREAMRVAGLTEPPNPGYPDSLAPWLHRKVRLGCLADLASLDQPQFIKPAYTTKLFNGFVYDPARLVASLDEHDTEQLRAIGKLPVTTPIWISEVVEFLSEVRYYVMASSISGQGRYDPDGADTAPLPDRQCVERAIAAYASPAPFAIDMGVLADGRTALVEVHDAWAIGLYGRALNPKDYYAFLRRWWDHHLSSHLRASATADKAAT